MAAGLLRVHYALNPETSDARENGAKRDIRERFREMLCATALTDVCLYFIFCISSRKLIRLAWIICLNLDSGMIPFLVMQVYYCVIVCEFFSYFPETHVLK